MDSRVSSLVAVSSSRQSSRQSYDLRPLSSLLRPAKKRRTSDLPLTEEDWTERPDPPANLRQSSLPASKARRLQQFLLSKKQPVNKVVASAAAVKLALKVITVFALIPAATAFLGYIVDRLLYGDYENATSFHRTGMVFSGLVAAPFILVRWCWKWPDKLTALELTFYGIHTSMFLTTVITTMIDGVTAHFVARQIRETFASSKYTSISTADDVYDYMADLMQRIYQKPSIETWSQTLHPLPGKLAISGPVRVKQTRMKRRACADTLYGILKPVNELTCYPQYSESDEETEPYGTGINFTYVDLTFLNYAGVEIKLSDIYTLGRFNTYHLSGYWAIFATGRMDKNQAMDMIEAMRNASWIDEQTSQISLDLSVLTKDVPRPIVSNIVLTIEMSVAGMFVTMSPSIRFSYLDYLTSEEGHLNTNICRMPSTQSSFLLPVYLAVLPIVIYTAFSLLYQLHLSWRDFLRSTYTYVEGMWIAVVIATLIFRWRSIYYSHCQTVLYNQPLWPTDDIAPVYMYEVIPMGENWQRGREMLSIALFLYVFNSLKFLTKIMSFDTVGKTLAYAFSNLASFAISFCVIFLAFTVMFYLLFSADDNGYATFQHSIATVWNALLGNIDINNDLVGSRYLYLPLLIVFTFFLAFVLLTVVIAIVTEAFEKTKLEHIAARRLLKSQRRPSVLTLVRRRAQVYERRRRTSTSSR